jgi:predicted nucleotidyltransferase
MTLADFDDVSLQLDFADRLSKHLQQDPRVRAVWLEGSLGRERGDRHADVDLHIALKADDLSSFRADLEARLGQLYPVLKHHELFGGTMVGTILVNEARRLIALQTWLETKEEFQITAGRAKVLFDREGLLQVIQPTPPDADAIRRALYVEICYFWSLFATLPTLERGELLAGLQYLHHGVNQLIFVFALGRGRLRDVGNYRLNEMLEPAERQQLEAIMTLPELSGAAIIRANHQLAEIMQSAGRAACETWNAEYPAALEEAVRTHVAAELQRMGNTRLEVSA